MLDQTAASGAADGPATTRGKTLLLSLLTLVVSLVLFLGVAEIALRFLPVSSTLQSLAVNSGQPIFHFRPNRNFANSHGWTMHSVTRHRINNAGFVNDQDYRRDDPLPLVAVIGDSYIEARMVPYAETVQGRLARSLAGERRVYSFAAAGAPLSQYLIWAGHAVREYSARAIVINVVGNDFDESLASYKLGPGFWLYSPDGDGTLHLRLNDYDPGWGITILRESALARYLILNLKFYETIFRVRALGELIFGTPAQAETRYAGNTDASVGAVRVADSLKVADAFFRDLPNVVGLEPKDILFTLDGFRYPEAAREGRGSYFDLMRRAFLETARSLGYEAIDLEPLFAARNAQTGERFEFEDDGHWNGNGHGVAAEAIASSKLMARLRQ
jgi:hypothetical protein